MDKFLLKRNNKISSSSEEVCTKKKKPAETSDRSNLESVSEDYCEATQVVTASTSTTISSTLIASYLFDEYTFFSVFATEGSVQNMGKLYMVVLVLQEIFCLTFQ